MNKEELEKKLSKQIAEIIVDLSINIIFGIGCYKFYYWGVDGSFLWFMTSMWLKLHSNSKK